VNEEEKYETLSHKTSVLAAAEEVSTWTRTHGTGKGSVEASLEKIPPSLDEKPPREGKRTGPRQEKKSAPSRATTMLKSCCIKNQRLVPVTNHTRLRSMS